MCVDIGESRAHVQLHPDRLKSSDNPASVYAGPRPLLLPPKAFHVDLALFAPGRLRTLDRV
jgi:hypothetical protein